MRLNEISGENERSYKEEGRVINSEFRFQTSLRVRYAEIDGQMIVFNGVYLTYLDVGITEYFRNLGLDYKRMKELGFDMSLVHTEIDFKQPAYLDDVLVIQVAVVKLGRTSYTANFHIFREGESSPVLLAQTVYVNFNAEQAKAYPIPDSVRTLISEFEGLNE